jgi:hypothetical protein
LISLPEDVAIWDSHPLTLGATPAQVFIDGIAQLKDPHVPHKPSLLQRPPKTPNFDREARETIEYDGLPPLRSRHHFVNGEIIKLINVTSVWVGQDEDGSPLFDGSVDGPRDVLIRNGVIVCVTIMGSMCLTDADLVTNIAREVDLKGGSLAPGLVTFGSPLGLEEINLEPSTNDGTVPDALTGSVPSIVGGTNAIIRAVDGLAFNGRNLL